MKRIEIKSLTANYENAEWSMHYDWPDFASPASIADKLLRPDLNSNYNLWAFNISSYESQLSRNRMANACLNASVERWIYLHDLKLRWLNRIY